MAANISPKLPIPIPLIAGKCLLFDAATVTWLRREHHISGVLLGTIPQAPQQNVFTGLPLQLMPEEATLLTEKGLAYVFDGSQAHVDRLQELHFEDRTKYFQSLQSEASKFAAAHFDAKQRQRKQALGKQNRSALETRRSVSSESCEIPRSSSGESQPGADSPRVVPTPRSVIASRPMEPVSMSITPATSIGLFPDPPAAFRTVPDSSASYSLYAHLHSLGYFISPGLRFGCQYMVYPGDPLRFHSHFLAMAFDWDDEIDLIDIVGRGRLGTGVKKSFLLGGRSAPETSNKVQDGVRTFSVEWAAM
ncbi:MAG: hypothetical protein Q9227_005868 [Pyrenula ochraceoflavens]